MPRTIPALPRRTILAAGLILPLAPVLAQAAPRSLNFAVFRNGTRIGEHRVSFSGDGDSLTATADATLTVKLGPVPVFRYRHHAVEKRAGGEFVSLVTSTDSNGKGEKVEAEKDGAVVRISGSGGEVTAPGAANPFTHWNPAVFTGPLFNPQTGKLLKARATRISAGHWQLRGDTEIDDWYDDTGAWLALKGKLDDTIEYRRI
jgi:hypothetical protein